nr:site-2 protease family protein [Candidatus Sigynarchaeota archaeon]
MQQTSNDLVNFLLNPFFLIAVVFWGIIALLVLVLGRFKKSKALSVFFPFIAMIRTTRLNKLLKSIALKSPRTWKVLFTIGIFVSFAFTIYGFTYFVTNFIVLLTNFVANTPPPPEAQITPLVPGLTINFETFSYLIIPILFVLTVHEFSHAIAANADGIPIKSTGVLGMGVFFIIGFGAFVEPDEKSFKRGQFSGWAKTRMAAAGSFSNAFLAVIALLIVLNFTSVISLSWGPPSALSIRTVYTTAQGGHNEGVLFPGDVLHEINGTRLSDLNLSLSSYLYNQVHQNDTLACLITRNGVNQTIMVLTGLPPPEASNQSIAFIGIQSEAWWPARDWLGTWLGGTFPNTLQLEFYWLWAISISVTIFNMMPLPIFDGDKCIYEVISYFIKPRKEIQEVKDKFVIGKDSKTCELSHVNVQGVNSVVVLPNRRNQEKESMAIELTEHMDYQITDSDGDGKMDHVSFELSDKDLAGITVEISYNADVDTNESKKQYIMNIIRVIALVLIFGNFVISGITMGFTMPFFG